MDEVWGSEITLYYPGLYAGATDLVGIYEGRESIIDFKQSNRPKKESGLKITLRQWQRTPWHIIMYMVHKYSLE